MKMKTPPTFKDTSAAVVLYKKGVGALVPEIARNQTGRRIAESPAGPDFPILRQF